MVYTGFTSSSLFPNPYYRNAIGRHASTNPLPGYVCEQWWQFQRPQFHSDASQFVCSPYWAFILLVLLQIVRVETIMDSRNKAN